MSYPHIQQHDEKDCGAACLSMIATYYGAKYPIATFRELIQVDNQGANIYGLVTGAEKIGLDADALEGSPEELMDGISKKEISFPFIARIVNQFQFEHYIVIYGKHKKGFIIGDPAKPKITAVSAETFFEQWQGQIITFSPNDKFKKVNKQKGTFKKYFKYITAQKKLLSFVFVVSMIITAINLSGSFVFQYVVNNAVYGTYHTEEEDYDDDEDVHTHEETEAEEESSNQLAIFVDDTLTAITNTFDIALSNLETVCIIVILMYLFRCGLNILRGYLLSLTAKKVDVPLTLNYYNQLMVLPEKFYGTRKSGEFMSRFYDTSNIRDAISSATLTIMLDTIMAIACGALLFYINMQLFLITLIVMIVYAVIMFFFRKPIKSINHEIMENEAQVTSYFNESIHGIHTIKAYRYEANAIEKTKKLYEKFANNHVKASLIYTLQDSLVTVVESVGIVVLLWIGAVLCGKGIILLSDLFIFYYLIGYFLDPVKNLINLQPELQTAMVAAERLNDILDAKPERKTGTPLLSAAGTLHIQNVSFRYGNRDLVLKNVSMKIQQGQKIAIVGESGSGKTTLAKLLLAFYAPEQGNIFIQNQNLKDCSIDSVRQHISYISQDIFLFSDTIYNNLRMGNETISDDDIEDICKKCYADDFIQKLPMGYQTVIEENGNHLSGGQKQQLAIARALLQKPDILILDEATSNLDSITEESIQQTLTVLSKNTTCIIIAHRLRTIQKCDYIYVMEHGEIQESGTHEELLYRKSRYYNYWKNQI